MMKEIYLDNSATTPLSDTAKKAMQAAMEVYGNPSSLHTPGQKAHTLVEEARRNIAVTLGMRGTHEAGQIFFTSCGSEADNLAVLGTAYAKPRRRGGRIITTDSEHPGVENAMRALEADGFDVVRISTKGGVLDMEQMSAALNDRVFLVSMMMVNNETGALYDLASAFALAKMKNPDIVTHTDAVQGYLKCRFTPQALKADMVTLSAHKVNGPKGVGALYVSPEALKRRDLIPLLLGGGQEDGFRSGTENTVGIAGFGAAAYEGFSTLTAGLNHLRGLHENAVTRLSALPVRLNLPASKNAPHILSVTLPEIRSETMLHALSSDGIFVSNGSACSSHAQNISRSLLSFGLSEREAACTVRLSFGKQNTQEDIDALVASLTKNIDRLVRMRR